MGYQTRYSGGDVAVAAFGGVPAHTFPPIGFVTQAALSAANDTLYARVLNGYTTAATAVRINIGTSSGNICVAVYADNGSGMPGLQIATSGSVASPGTGTRSISLTSTVDVRPGMWLAISADNTTVTFARGSSPGSSLSVFGAKFQAIEASAFPAPALANGASAWRGEYIMVAE